MEKKRNLRILLVLILVLCLCLAGAAGYRSRFAYVGELRFEKSVEELDLSGVSVADWECLQSFSQVKRIDLRDTGISSDEYDRVRSWFPEAEILWDIPFQGTCLDMNTEELVLTSLSREDMETIARFSALKRIDGENCPEYALLDQLRREYPNLEMIYRVPVAGQWYSWDTTQLELAGQDPEELAAAIPYLPGLDSIHLIDPAGEGAALVQLRERFPDVALTWQLEFKDMTLEDTAEKLDLTGIPTTVEEIESLIPFLPKLNYVDMTDCGISNEEMDALNRRHENVKIVWTVTLGKGFRVRTDATWFMPVKFEYYPTGDMLYNLRYCTDMIAIDVGHMSITDCEFVAFMPHLQYLILADTRIRDLTPLTGLTELKYAELFKLKVDDFSPLLTLTGLEDLNICNTRGDPEMIAQMTWLKNLWWGYWAYVGLGGNEQEMLRKALPDCNICFDTKSSTGWGWRDLPNYYAQRDIFGMYYMDT